MPKGYVCETCGEFHKQPAICYGFDVPYDWENIVHENEENCLLTNDICVIDDKYFYIKGQIEIPVLGKSDSFVGMFGFL